MNDARQDTLKAIFTASLAAVAPDGAVLRHLALGGDILRAGEQCYDLSRLKTRVVGAGKGAAPMAAALEALLGPHITEGEIVVKYGHGLPLTRITLSEAAHPVPDAAGLEATLRMLDIATSAGEDDLLICLFTGGASALTPCPRQGLCLDDLQKTAALLLACGATIDEFNAIRKHLSAFSGGQLARIAYPARVLSIIVSDVVGDPLDVIASGPTVPDPSTFADCASIIEKYSLHAQLPAAVRNYLAAGLAGRVEESPKAGAVVFKQVENLLVGTNSQALQAAANKAAELGYQALILTDTLTGEAREVAADLIAQARVMAKDIKAGHKPLCLLAGGETTVNLRGKGKGGRNQEMALAAALAMEGDHSLAALFAGTDGTDGPTEAAGGFAFAHSAEAIRQRANPQHLLDNNDSNTALHLSGDVFITGPTRTNVMDISIILVAVPRG